MARSRRQQAGFVVLKSPDMPSVLLELGYLSNDLDERRLQDGGYQDQIASAIVAAIESYFLAES
jgi:N-acetylmuramoyl-L-alanine amidase